MRDLEFINSLSNEIIVKHYGHSAEPSAGCVWNFQNRRGMIYCKNSRERLTEEPVPANFKGESTGVEISE